MKNLIFQCMALSCAAMAFSQELDTIRPLEEVIVIGQKKDLNLLQSKPLSTLDEFLDSGSIGMVRRGSYAWEPLVNGMATERTLITIEGMHIFGACTDKMDPVTSYVEVSNLSEAGITSGQQGGLYGATIGGAVDLRRNRTGFAQMGWKTTASAGYETNGSQAIAGAAVNYSTNRFFTDTDFMFRKAGDYEAGRGLEVPFSQFTKINASATSGFKIGKRSLVEASLILDRATDVGYPALPMDVSLAEAVIASVRFETRPADSLVQKWESKIYFNAVTHVMDDTGRPNVPIHMDMPGRTRTFGGFSAVNAKWGRHKLRANLNAYYNFSHAEMTMYPQDPNESTMYMLTWPDVETLYSGIFLEDAYEFHCHSVLKVSVGAGLHNNSVGSDLGLESLEIFYPRMSRSNTRLLKSLAANYAFGQRFAFDFGIGYGERAPSVSEGYGFYLFNSFDGHDYIGNPNLPNEKSAEVNASAAYHFGKSSVRATAAFFRISDYIIGIPDLSLIPMTIGAEGVRVYESVPYAQIANLSGTVELQLHKALRWKNRLTYSCGADNQGGRLPLIAPLDYSTSLVYKKGAFSCEGSFRANAKQNRYASQYGEDETPAYAIADVSGGYVFNLGKFRNFVRAGIENVLDSRYSTYADWNNIPAKGRNCFVNLVVQY